MIEVSTPLSWNSVHRPIEYVYDFDGAEILAATAYTGNYLQIATASGFSGLAVGDYIYIDTGFYKGLHKILVIVSAVDFVLDVQYDVSKPVIGYGMLAIEIPEITLWSGYDTGEGFDTELPLTEVATFTPEVSTDIKIRFDVSGYLKSIFRIQPPEPVGNIDFSLFNRFRIEFNGVMQDHYQVLNSAIESSVLVSEYFGTGKYLNENLPIVFGCGKTILSKLDVTGVVVVQAVEGDTPQFDYQSLDYNSNDYLTPLS